VGGNVLIFSRLAKLLGSDQPFYGLQARGLDGKEAPFISVPEMASHFVKEIKKLRSQGPYVIAGACSGGLIAYEMAQQLMAQREEVVLMMLETWHPSSYRAHMNRSLMRLRLPLIVIRKIVEILQTFLRTPPKDRKSFLQIKAKQLRIFLHGGATEEEIRLNEAWRAGFQVERLTKATFYAAAHYKVQPYPGKLLNCIASKRTIPDGTRDTRNEWMLLTEGGADTIYISAENAGLLFVSPYVEELANHVQRYLVKTSSPAVTLELQGERVCES
jgi:thioesterase domain-containing protein